MMDRSSKATVIFRAGTLLVAIALAFGLISYMSSSTVSGFHANQCYYGLPYQCGNVDVVPAGTYTVLNSWNPASPQQMYFFNMSTKPGNAEIYLLNTDQTSFNVWMANRSGLPLANISPYGPQELAWFSDYVASHKQEVASHFGVSGINVVVKYFVPDVEPLMAVVTNGKAQPSLNLTHFDTSVGVMINPSLGFGVTGYLTASGVVLA
ncbi:MAG TPA: hypothetical protein VGR53_03670, partial [Nitrososphaerales archaeon]|nr:hypothetical protein [Nitrososphaerales archaeon]